MGQMMKKAWPQANDADQDQVNCNDVVEQAWHEQDQYAGNQRDERWKNNKIEIEGHGAASVFSAFPE
jgi:hypothetical protein